MYCHGNRVTPPLGILNEQLNVPPVHGICNGTADHQSGPINEVNIELNQLSLVNIFLLDRREGEEACVCV